MAKLGRKAWVWVGVGILATILLVAVVVWVPRVQSPQPQPVGEAPELPDLGVSVLNLPVLYDMGRVPELLESVVPAQFGDLSERRGFPGAERLQLAFQVERDPFSVTLQGDTAYISTVLRYQARGWYDPPVFQEVTGACGTGEATRPRARLVLSSPLALNEDWTLESELRVESLEPLTADERDRCRVTEFQVDLTDWIMLGARTLMEEWKDEISRSVSAMDLREQVEGQWRQLGEPMAVGDGVWLALNPSGIRYGSLRAADEGGDVALLELALELRPEVITGSTPQASTASLPPLQRGDVGSDSRLLVEARADYGLISKLADQALGGREFEAGGRTIQIQDVEVRGVGDGRVAVELEVTGAVRGRLFLVGTPAYDPHRNELSVPDLTFHVETRNVLARAAQWVLQTGFSQRIRDEARWPMATVLQGMPVLQGATMSRELAPEVHLEGRFGSLEITRVVALSDAVVVRTALEGTARLLMD